MFDLVGAGVITPFIWFGLLAWLAYSSYVFACLVRSDQYGRAQLLGQAALMLVLPVVGAIIVHALFRALGAEPTAADKNHIPERSEEDGIGPRWGSE